MHATQYSGRVLNEEELAAMLADAADLSDLGRGPVPAVLDTDLPAAEDVRPTKASP